MYADKTTRWLRKAVKQHRRVLNTFRCRFFWSDEDSFEKFRIDVLDRLIIQQKLMEEELDKRMGRT